MPAPPRRHVGQYVASGDWSDYWTTRISRAESGKIRVRGYPIEELIEHLSYSEAAFLLLRGELPDERETSLFDLALRSGMDQQLINTAACAARCDLSASASRGEVSGMARCSATADATAAFARSRLSFASANGAAFAARSSTNRSAVRSKPKLSPHIRARPSASAIA